MRGPDFVSPAMHRLGLSDCQKVLTAGPFQEQHIMNDRAPQEIVGSSELVREISGLPTLASVSVHFRPFDRRLTVQFRRLTAVQPEARACLQ